MKKIITIILSVLMMTGLIMPASAFEDTAGTPYEEAVKLLFDLGIVDGKSNTSYAPEDSLTRAEMVTYALRIVGLDGQGGGRQIFEDVTEEHWAYGNITTAYELGLVVGVGENIFQPDAPVTFAQAVKILVKILGYTLQSEAEGGYPSGYLIWAQRIGLLEGVPQSEEINRGVMALLVANALDISPSTLVSYGDSDGRVAVLENETLLSYYLGVDTYEGRVTANYLDTVVPGEKTGEGEIAVDGKLFSAGKTNAESFVGQKVTIRAKEEENGKLTILHIEADGDSRLQVQGDAIITDKTTKSQLTLEGENGKEEVYSIENDAVFVYNGINKAWTEADLASDSSAYTFIVSNAGKISVIFQESYVNHVVKSVSNEQKKVFFKDGGSITLTDDAWKKYSVVRTDGSTVDVKEIKEWDILSVSANGTEVLKAILSDVRIEGTVTEISEKDVLIDGTAYEVAKSLSGSTETQPAIGRKSIFSLDAYGKIAAVNNDVLTENYAFLVTGEKTKGISGVTKLKLFLLSGEMQVFEVAEKVEFNDSVKDGSALLEEPVLKNGDVVARQLITYETNEEGKITEIRTAVDGRSMGWQERQGVFSSDFEILKTERGSAGNYIGYTMSSLASRYKLTDKTRILVIPEADNAADIEYGVRAFKDVKHGEGLEDSILYDVDKDNVISIIVQKKAFEKKVTYGTENVAVVDRVADMLDNDGTPVRALRIVLPSGTERALPITDDATLEILSTGCISDVQADPYINKTDVPFTALDTGDVIQYEVDGQGRITCAAVRFRYKYRYALEKSLSQYGDRPPEPNYNYNGTQYLYGRVDRAVENGVVLYAPAAKDGTEYERLFSAIQDKTLLYNSVRGTVTAMDYQDMEEGDNIFVLRILTDMMVAVIYR